MSDTNKRTVRILETNIKEVDKEKPLSFQSFYNINNIILLGEPGLGKTHLFQLSFSFENAKFLSVRQFLAIEGDGCEGYTIYLDALDEYRSRIDDKNLIIELIRALRKLNHPKIRLSCRIADWLGDTDLKLFQPYFQETSFVVLVLEPLQREEIKEILIEKGISQGEEFIYQAEEKGLEGLLTNPQTLIMLADVVKHGSWPSTKLELFDKSVGILLTEHNRDRIGSCTGQYASNELILPAGAICSAILISGVSGISLLETQLSDDFPSYRTVPFDNQEMVRASLMSRAFIGIRDETVTYLHRTIAEFLGANWLAYQIHQGVPLRRIQSLLGVKSIPVAEIRGLHAWLTNFLPEHASILIQNDPYGVLMYGDSSSLSTSDRRSLFLALENLSITDPWFRAGNWSDKQIGALSGSDIIDSFKRVLQDSNSAFHLRSLVLDAIRNGPPTFEFDNILVDLLSNSKVIYSERVRAFKSLLRTDEGVSKIVNVYSKILINDPSSYRLRVDILSILYNNYFNPSDVTQVLIDRLCDCNNRMIGGLSGLSHSLPIDSLPDILDEISKITKCKSPTANIANLYGIESFYTTLVARVLQSTYLGDPEKLLNWLHTRTSFRCHSGDPNGTSIIYEWLKENQLIILEMYVIFIKKVEPNKSSYLFLHEFKKLTLNAIQNESLAEKTIWLIDTYNYPIEKECLLYEVCGALIFSSPARQDTLIEKWFQYGKKSTLLQEIRTNCMKCNIETWRQEDNEIQKNHKLEKEQKKLENIKYLNSVKNLIQTGQHLNCLGWLAEIYFDLHEANMNLKPFQRLSDEVGIDLAICALNGFCSLIKRDDLPNIIKVSDITTNLGYYQWWYAILAGMDEAWKTNSNLNDFSESLLSLAFSIDTLCPSTLELDGNVNRHTYREWKEKLYTERSDLIEKVYDEISRSYLSIKNKPVDVLYDLAFNEKTIPWCSFLSIRLLRDFPKMHEESLRYLLISAISEHKCQEDLKNLVNTRIRSCPAIKGKQRSYWLLFGFLLDYASFKRPFENHFNKYEYFVWTIIDIIEKIQTNKLGRGIDLSVLQFEFLIQLIGKQFSYCSQPTESTGSQNPWDASNFIVDCIKIISILPYTKSLKSLKRLQENASLVSYRDYISHAISNLTKMLRQVEYKQPNWDETIEVLRGGKPANIADLYALVFDHLRVLKENIRYTNTDTYKTFWKCSPYNSVLEPQVEEFCRDRLIELLKPSLLPLDLRVEPEGHMANDKRADIVIFSTPGLKLSIELKRDSHPDLWESCINQLERLYTRDPESAGYGIYAVFWFGDKRKGRIPKPPNGISKPRNAEELTESLYSKIPNDKKGYLEVIVFDVSPLQ